MRGGWRRRIYGGGASGDDDAVDVGAGEVFRYSDINFIMLGYMVQKLSGEPLDVYAQEHIFTPLGMTETRYLPLAKACGPHRVVGAAIAWAPAPKGRELFACPKGDWSTSLLVRIAPEAHDDEAKADLGRILITIGCCAGRCMIRRRGGWVAWRDMRGCSRRRMICRCLRRRCWIGWRGGRVIFR